MSYDKIIRDVGLNLIVEYSLSGKVKSGCNGPYNDEETNIRNLCHLIVITAIENKLSNKKFKNELIKMGEQLLNSAEISGLYVLRKSSSKDTSNGVIGHAWVIEALLYLYYELNDRKYIERAIKIFEAHKFDYRLGLWKRPSINGTKPTIDFTFNHQLWFAASACELFAATQNIEIKEKLEIFLKKLPSLIRIDRNGLICHNILIRNTIIGTLKAKLKRFLDIFNRYINKPSFYYKENGYHIFNVAAFARMYRILPEYEFWNSSKFNAIINYLNSEKLQKELLKNNITLDKSLKNNISDKKLKKINIYGYPYNVPGFEFYYIKQVFGDKVSTVMTEKYLSKQIELTYDETTKKFGKFCNDVNTINYRIYEYYRGLEMKIINEIAKDKKEKL